MAFILIRLKYWDSETLLVEVKMVATGLLCTPAKQDKVSPAFKTLRFPHTSGVGRLQQKVVISGS